jgi:hypothetical protein
MDDGGPMRYDHPTPTPIVLQEIFVVHGGLTRVGSLVMGMVGPSASASASISGPGMPAVIRSKT